MIPKREADPEALLKRMAGLCAKSEQCTFDISTKLYKAGLAREKREEIINYLREHRYLDDARFARSFASYKVRFSGWGKRKIRAALGAKRIESNLISDAIEAIEERDYEEAIMRAIAAKKNAMGIKNTEDEQELSHDQRVKLFRHLLARGFESDFIGRHI